MCSRACSTSPSSFMWIVTFPWPSTRVTGRMVYFRVLALVDIFPFPF
jgi:hypothetical protein